MKDDSLSRREALKRVIGLSIALSAAQMPAFASAPVPGIGRDPNLLKKEIPWPLLLDDSEMKIVTVLGDIMIPADEHGPAASAVGVPAFINEWVSAPYPDQEADLKTIRGGLAWLDQEAKKRFGKGFAAATSEQQHAIVEDIVAPKTEARRAANNFFRVFRDRCAGGYYSTPEGWKAIGYVGNVPLAEFPAPPPEVLQHLGLDAND
ncbi:MAG: gluconate 2-dehydrogenase subunit 3 family protein [Chthoniobacteraceae bacterium]